MRYFRKTSHFVATRHMWSFFSWRVLSIRRSEYPTQPSVITFWYLYPLKTSVLQDIKNHQYSLKTTIEQIYRESNIKLWSGLILQKQFNSVQSFVIAWYFLSPIYLNMCILDRKMQIDHFLAIEIMINRFVTFWFAWNFSQVLEGNVFPIIVKYIQSQEQRSSPYWTKTNPKTFDTNIYMITCYHCAHGNKTFISKNLNSMKMYKPWWLYSSFFFSVLWASFQ